MRRLATMILCGWATVGTAAEPQTLKLWDTEIPEPRVKVDGPETDIPPAAGQRPIRRTTNIMQPSLVVFPAAAETRNGTAIIVIPGGGFRYLTTDLEGSEACEYFQQRGVTAFLLKHRCPTHEQSEPNAGPVQDAQQAVRLVRTKANEWGVKRDQIGVLGFSAGGQVALIAAVSGPQGVIAPAIHPPQHRPNFLLLAYPWGLYVPAEKGLRKEIEITEETPPMFIAQAADDKASLPQGSTLLYLQCLEHKVPAELHIYERGGHGFGIRSSAAPATTDWLARATQWLEGRKLIDPVVTK